MRAEQGSELGSQLHGGFEAAVGAEVVFENAVRRAGDVTGRLVERLDLTTKALGDTRINQAHAAEFGSECSGVERADERGAIGVGR